MNKGLPDNFRQLSCLMDLMSTYCKRNHWESFLETHCSPHLHKHLLKKHDSRSGFSFKTPIPWQYDTWAAFHAETGMASCRQSLKRKAVRISQSTLSSFAGYFSELLCRFPSFSIAFLELLSAMQCLYQKCLDCRYPVARICLK